MTKFVISLLIVVPLVLLLPVPPFVGIAGGIGVMATFTVSLETLIQFFENRILPLFKGGKPIHRKTSLSPTPTTPAISYYLNPEHFTSIGTIRVYKEDGEEKKFQNVNSQTLLGISFSYIMSSSSVVHVEMEDIRTIDGFASKIEFSMDTMREIASTTQDK
ncbi:hypothetical protein IMZ31_19725 (plasmid) [Pontibacillus sp. ALD_SL1]|uniref:hypothetical protein n=1 Tax=Pontibacillus sp. ALD_SL1 TaxID=2777185 RepID=UPI001A9567C9|nr:hypothetical protein [Pontibacillus sp. ALD_SL1]QST02781.1 hypothetical protein IMZ31_19725 [Pontibacillus sp. ALD_SL1]